MTTKLPPLVPTMMAALLATCPLPCALSQNANDGFDPRPDWVVFAIAPQADGKIVLGGAFTNVAGTPRRGLARLNIDGSLDPSFDPAPDSFVTTVALQADGKILVGGFFSTLGGQPRQRIGRLHPDGSVDLDFNPGITHEDPEENPDVEVIRVQADGKIVVGGEFTTLGGQSRTNLGRLHIDGSVDASFNPGANRPVYDLVQQTDGKIVVSGDFSVLGGRARPYLGRLNTDGGLDTSFNPDWSGGSGPLALQADGGILLGAGTLKRFRANGTLDTMFDPRPEVEGCLGCGSVWCLAVQPDGKILLGGYFTKLGDQARSRLGRLLPDGTVDPGFNPGPNSTVHSLAVQADGNILVGGYFTNLAGMPRTNMGRLYPDGSLDATLNPGVDGTPWSLALQPDGKILVAGHFATLAGTGREGIGRLHPDGRLDDTLTLGLGTNLVPCSDAAQSGQCYRLSSADSLVTYLDRSFLVGGFFTIFAEQPRSSIARIKPDNSLDEVFNLGTEGTVKALAVQADGKVLVGGTFQTVGGLPRTNLARLNPDSTVDASFAPSAGGGIDAMVTALTLQPDGKILVGGTFTTLAGQPRNRIGRLLPDGSLDPSFNAGLDDFVHALVVQPDGKILIGGRFTSVMPLARARITRLHSNGMWDLSFSALGADGSVRSVVPQTNGKILVAGAFTYLGGQPCNYVGRLNPDGSFDAVFNARADSWAFGLMVQADGKILVEGYFAQLGGQPRLGIGRLTTGEAAFQKLELNETGETVIWYRSGASPEISDATFEFSPDGTNYVLLGRGTRINGGWHLRGLSLPAMKNFHIRASGRAAGGYNNASWSLLESVRQFYLPPRITGIAKLDNGTLTLTGAGAAGQTCVLHTATNLTSPAWTAIATNTSNANGLVTFPDQPATEAPQRFYRIEWP